MRTYFLAILSLLLTGIFVIPIFASEEEIDFSEFTETESTEPKITISGFFDLELNKLDTSDSTMKSLIRDDLTFSNSHLNIYLNSQIAPKFRFFCEMRFLHQPSTLFTEENLADRFQGSLLIERAWTDWNYRNEINIRAGKFLTPYGIWNVEHGGPILISTRTPLLLRKQIFPESITGLQFYGRIFPADFQIGYHAWIGNGKGPTSAIQDTDDHKSIGGRLAIRLPLDQKIELGVSGYSGHVEDAEFIPSMELMGRIGTVFDSDVGKSMVDMDGMDEMMMAHQAVNLDDPDEHDDDEMDGMDMDEPDAMEMSKYLTDNFMSKGFTARGEAIKGYTDRAIGVDLALDLFNFEIQGEIVLNSVEPFKADAFKEIGGYAQIAYGIWTDFGKITPFVRTGFSDPNDKLDYEIGELKIVTFGLNYKPKTGIVLKSEFHLHKFSAEDRNFPMFANSLSVAF